MTMRTCVTPGGKFLFGIHKPEYKARNLREKDSVGFLGEYRDGSPVDNRLNFPPGTINERNDGWVFEIPNAFPFRGATFISKPAADRWAQNPLEIGLALLPHLSFTDTLSMWFSDGDGLPGNLKQMFETLPEPLQLAVAGNSTDPTDLIQLAALSCEFVHNPDTGLPVGLVYDQDETGKRRPIIHNYLLFKALANNPHLPDTYKMIMVLRPGVQGDSEIVGEWRKEETASHVFEYLRRNSYIPWGHYAANMADDAIRYRIRDLSLDDMRGMRHLYYQRTYIRLSDAMGIPGRGERKRLTEKELDELRRAILKRLHTETPPTDLAYKSTLWGWNFGFDYAPSKYRLHASHQQIHQQYALVPETADTVPSFAYGDLVSEFIRRYRDENGTGFFEPYIQAIRGNERTDGNRERESDLIVYENEKVLLFVPKAQTSQWELQVLPLEPVGNILEADTETRRCIDEAILVALRILEDMGARMVTGFEISKRFLSPDRDHRLLYCFMPRIPESPGAFSETQLRYINNHYPEDFAIACRSHLDHARKGLYHD